MSFMRKRFIGFGLGIGALVFIIGIGLTSEFYFNKNWLEVRNILSSYHLNGLADALPIRSIGNIKVNTWKGETNIKISGLDFRLGTLIDKNKLESTMQNYRPFTDIMVYPLESLAIADCENINVNADINVVHITNVNEKIVTINATDARIGNIVAELYIVNFDDNTFDRIQELLEKGDFSAAFAQIYIKNIVLAYTPYYLLDNYKKVVKTEQSSVKGDIDKSLEDALSAYKEQMWKSNVVNYMVARNAAKLRDFIVNGGVLKLNLFFAEPVPLPKVFDYISGAEIMDTDTESTK